MPYENLLRRRSIKNHPGGDVKLQSNHEQGVVLVMPTHVFELNKIDIPTSATPTLEEGSVVSWAEAENVLLELASSFPLSNATNRQTVPGSAGETEAGSIGLPVID